MPNVFTYGSLMYPEVFEPVALAGPQRHRACLDGWVRRAIDGKTYPAAVPLPGARIDGVVWMGLSQAAMRRLDEFEGHEYRREQVDVVLPGGERVSAEVYRWLDPDSMLACEWSTEEFERRHLREFFRIHGA